MTLKNHQVAALHMKFEFCKTTECLKDDSRISGNICEVPKKKAKPRMNHPRIKTLLVYEAVNADLRLN